MVLNFIQSLLVFTFFLWIVFLGLSFLFQRQQQYWNWSGNTIQRIFRDYWRYILIFALGYYAAIENFFQLSIHI